MYIKECEKEVFLDGSDFVLLLASDATVSDENLERLKTVVKKARPEVAAFELRHTPSEQPKYYHPSSGDTLFLDITAFAIRKELIEKYHENKHLSPYYAGIDLGWELRVSGFELKYLYDICVKCSTKSLQNALDDLYLRSKYGSFKTVLKGHLHAIREKGYFARLPSCFRARLFYYSKRRTMKANGFTPRFHNGYSSEKVGKAFIAPKISPNKKISIILPSDLGKEAVLSLKQQSYKNFETIKLEKNDYESAIKKAKGDYLLFMNYGMLLYPDHLETLLKIAEKKNKNLVCSCVFELGVDGEEVRYVANRDYNELSKTSLLHQKPFKIQPFLIRKSLVEKYGAPECELGPLALWLYANKLTSSGEKFYRIQKTTSAELLPVNSKKWYNKSIMQRLKGTINFFGRRLNACFALFAIIIGVAFVLIFGFSGKTLLDLIIFLATTSASALFMKKRKGNFSAVLSLVLSTIFLAVPFYFYRERVATVVYLLPILILNLCSHLDLQVPHRRRNYFICIMITILLSGYFIILTQQNNLLLIASTLVSLLAPAVILLIFLLRNFRFSFKKYHVTKTPKTVTAVIPNYNYANYLESRVLSIISQTYPISELIILDDKSTDDSLKVIDKIVKALKNTHPSLSVRVIANEENSGKVFKQWKKAFEEASGDYLWICEADDLCDKHFLNAVMQGFEKDEKVVLSYSESKMIDDEGYTLMRSFVPWIDYRLCGHWRKSYINDGKEELKEVSAINNTITNVSGVVFKLRSSGEKDFILPYLKYIKAATNFRLAGDWYFYAKILMHGKIAYHAESLNWYRSHTGSVSKTTDNYTHYQEILAVQSEIEKNVALPKATRQYIEKRRAERIKEWGLSEELNLANYPLRVGKNVPLSIIIPVYNVEKYLHACLNSVFANLPKNSEVIIVNDASPDESEKIIREFMNLHPEIKYKKLVKNSGLSAARNAGLKLATGEFVTFLDPDDSIAVNMYQTMLKKAISEQSELVYCDIMVVYPPEPNHHDPLAVEPRRVWSSTANESESSPLLKLLGTDLAASACNKLFKRTLFDGVVFPEGLNNEDVAVIPLLAARAKNPVHIAAPYYNYIQRKSSIQGNGGVFNEKRLVIFDTVSLCLSNARRTLAGPVYDELEGALIVHQLIVILIYAIADLRPKERRQKYIKIFCKKLKNLEFNAENPYLKSFLSNLCMPKILEIALSAPASSVDRYIIISRAKNVLKGIFKRTKK